MEQDRPKKKETNRAREERITREQQVQRPNDAIGFQTRNNIYTQNANLFISNNANPFLISPYGPPANLISKQVLEQLSTVISTLIGDLGQVLNLSTYTLRISTITPVSTSFDPSQSVTISSNIFNVIGQTPTSQMNVTMSSNFNIISTNFLSVQSTLTASTINFTNLVGTTFTANSLAVNSTLTASTINFINLNGRDAFTSTLNTSSIVASTLNVSSIVASTLNLSSIVASTIQTATYVSTTELIFSSLFISPTTLGGSVGPGASLNSIYIDIGGTQRRIPFYA